MERGTMYQRIAYDLRARISGRELAPGVPLPAVPALAERYGARQGAVREALELLAEEGLVETRPGRGWRVRPTAGEKDERQKTAYRRVMDGLLARLAAGEFAQADRLPSETELMDTFKVSRNTVRRAYRELVYEGVVVVRHGAGAYPAFCNAGAEADWADGEPEEDAEPGEAR